ncbi:MAG: hypothetical protein MJZ82_00910 [Paludibacteraceae bacterium]|nr:hypothetical protein [Paludibacteraceae bacterium]
MNIKLWIYNRRKERLPKRQVIYRNWSDIRTIALLYTSDLTERNPDIRRMAEYMQENNKHVTLIGYADKKEITSPILPQSRIAGQKDFSWLGYPNEMLTSDLQKQSFDLLIDLTQHQSLQERYMALYLRSDLKVGRRTDAGELDFMIEMPSEETREQLMEEIVKYLTLIRSNETN